jgi:ligand-binding SRPBCC domain-containing protein
MVVFTRETWVAAPIERVRDFHVRIDGLTAVTPDWMNLRVEGISGPDGEPDPETLEVGTDVRLSMRPFGVGPRQVWTARIVSREEETDAALLTDEMIDGPFETWEHTHAFYADDGATLLRDRIEYEFPVGPLGPVVDPVALLPLELLFRYRHHRTRKLLEREVA